MMLPILAVNAAGLDVSGSWNIQVDTGWTVVSEATQSGNSVTFKVPTESAPFLEIAGTISGNTLSGQFRSGDQNSWDYGMKWGSVDATFSEDGRSFKGTQCWEDQSQDCHAWSGEKTLKLDDKLRQVLKIYQKRVPKGIVDSGKANNLLSWHPLKGEDFEPYTCGGYQSTVLKVLDELKFSEDPKERSLLDDLDYGPIEVQGGSHHAVVIYPKGTDWGKTGIILDPWIKQRPEAYSIKDWTNYFPDYWGPVGSSYYKESYPNYPTVGGSYKDPKGTGMKSGYPDKMMKKSGRAMGNCPLDLYLIDEAGRISGYSGDGRKDEITEALVRRAPLSDGTYWTEMGYPADGSCMLVMEGLDSGDATIFIGFGMDGHDYRSIYQYKIEVESGRVYELDLRTEGSPIISDADQITPEKIEEIDAAWLNSQPDLASIPEIQIDGDEGTDGVTEGMDSITDGTDGITEVPASTVILDNWNKGAVDNNPSCSPSFTISEPQMITYIDTYHWNYGSGTAAGGTISLRKDDGTEYGPWQVEAQPGMNGVPNAWWIAHPNEVIPAGTYTVTDSDPATWSQNSESQGCGFSKIEGYSTYSTSDSNEPLRTPQEQPILSPPSSIPQDFEEEQKATGFFSDWAGTWDTSWGEMVLQQSGSSVTGTYTHDQGRIQGTVSGNKLVGLWSEAPSYSPPRDAGDVELNMSPDCKSFIGNWRYGSEGNWSEDWTGTRLTSGQGQAN